MARAGVGVVAGVRATTRARRAAPSSHAPKARPLALPSPLYAASSDPLVEQTARLSLNTLK